MYYKLLTASPERNKDDWDFQFFDNEATAKTNGFDRAIKFETITDHILSFRTYCYNNVFPNKEKDLTKFFKAKTKASGICF